MATNKKPAAGKSTGRGGTSKTKTTSTRSSAKNTKQTAPMRSTTTAAKNIIRKEIRECYGSSSGRGAGTALENMQRAAEQYAKGSGPGPRASDWAKGAALVDAGCFRYWGEQEKLLKKIYGDKVKTWDTAKIYNTYRNLIGREYSAMLSEREKRKFKKAEEKAKKKQAKAGRRK